MTLTPSVLRNPFRKQGRCADGYRKPIGYWTGRIRHPRARPPDTDLKTSDWDNPMVTLPLHLSGRFVSLRDFTSADRDALAFFADDEAMFEFMKFRMDASWLARAVPRFLRQPELGTARRDFSLAAVAEDRFIGLVMIGELTEEKHAEFGWYLCSDAWGRGYATEATILLLDFGFHELGLVRMFATADPENGASIRVLTKSGLTTQGLTDPVQTWRGLRPRVLFTIDLEQWETSATELLG
jgi:[ribosomal protein S5]-alanine N-acetyltransferase